MDSTARKLMKRLDELERIRAGADREIESIRKALEISEALPQASEVSKNKEVEYVEKQTFAPMSLTDACKLVLRDFQGHWLSKSQIEYLVTRGGYKFTTKDSKNSVGIALQRLAADDFCEAERKRGATGNRYRYFESLIPLR